MKDENLNTEDAANSDLGAVICRSFDSWFKREGLMRLFNNSKADTLQMRGFKQINSDDYDHFGHKHKSQSPKDVALDIAKTHKLLYPQDEITEVVYLYKSWWNEVHVFARGRNWDLNGR